MLLQNDCTYGLSLDLFLRLASMGLLAFFFIYTLLLAKKAGKEGVDVKRKYFMAFSFFFLMFAINFVQTELNLACLYEYPRMVPSDMNVLGFINPSDIDIPLFLFFFLGAVPLAFAIEKYLLMHKKVPLTLLSSVALLLNVLMFFIRQNFIFTYVVILVDYLAMVGIVLTVLIIYLRFAITNTGSLRLVGLFMFIGLFLQLVGLILSSTSLGDFPLTGAELGHLIGLVGFTLIFASIIKMR